MHIGLTIFPTDYSIQPPDLAAPRGTSAAISSGTQTAHAKAGTTRIVDPPSGFRQGHPGTARNPPEARAVQPGHPYPRQRAHSQAPRRPAREPPAATNIGHGYLAGAAVVWRCDDAVLIWRALVQRCGGNDGTQVHRLPCIPE
jgi:hypothetical protein